MITADELQQVLRASDCSAALIQLDNEWAENSCDGEGNIGDPDDGASPNTHGSPGGLFDRHHPHRRS